MICSHEGALRAYQKTQRITQTGRNAEALALTNAALSLKKLRDNWSADNRRAELRKVLKRNQQMWSIFQGELARPDHPYPRDLREKLLSLSLFIDRRIFEIMADPSPDKLTAIIDINLHVAAGLRGSPSPDNGETSDM